MDIQTLIAVIGCTFAIILSMAALFLWVRSEANNDRRSISDIQREDRKDLLQISRNMEIILREMQQEMKEFHGRLCSLEGATKNKLATDP